MNATKLAERLEEALVDDPNYGPSLRLSLDYETVQAAARLLREMHEALEPFAKHIDEMKFDLDDKGNERPDDEYVGWVYVTNGDFRRARKAYEAKP